MPIARISGLGETGIIGDIPPFSIPDNALSFGKNVRAYHGRITNFPGSTIYTNPPIEPYGLFGFEAVNVATLLWLQAGLNQVYVYDGNTHSDITRTSGNYNTNEYANRWTGGVQQGIGFLCNGADSPQQWDKVDAGTKLKDMFWDPEAAAGSQTWGELNYSTFAMRAFAGCIFALGISRGSDDQPGTVAWSTFVVPNDGNSIDFQTKPTNSAGERAIGDTLGACIDAAPLRDDLIIYKEDSAWRCSFTGDANNPFVFSRLPNYVRLLNRGCIGVAREFHVVAAPEDVYVFDGNTFRSILEEREREYYRANLWNERKLTTFVQILDQEQEAWVCITSPGMSGELKSPDKALVWNYNKDSFSRNEIPNVRAMGQGPIVSSANVITIDDLVNPISTYNQPISTLGGEQAPEDSWLVGAYGTNLAVFGRDNSDNGTPRECVAERSGLILQDPESGVRSSDTVMRVQEVRPYLNATQSLEVRIGSQRVPTGPIKWENYKTFDPRIQERLTFRSTGRYFAYGVRSNADMAWELTEIGFSYHPQRKR